MLLQKYEELWSAPNGGPYMIVVSTCAVADRWLGLLTMNEGSARQAKEIYPELPRRAYRTIKERYPAIRLDGEEDYGFLPVINPPAGIGIFQTKRYWREGVQLETIRRSTEMLAEYAAAHPDVNIRLPFPGGVKIRRDEGLFPWCEDIEGMLNCLPDNVTVVQWGN